MGTGFDFGAHCYALFERLTYGHSLMEARMAMINYVLRGQRVLMIGEGDGRFLAECLQRKMNGTIEVIEMSGAMLSLTRKRIASIPTTCSLQLHHQDIFNFLPSGGKYDVIVTHLFFDLFRPANQSRLITIINVLCTAGATWIDVDFKPLKPSMLFKIIDWLQYRFDQHFNGVEAGRHYDPAELMSAGGWHCVDERLFLRGCISSQRFERTSPPLGKALIL